MAKKTPNVPAFPNLGFSTPSGNGMTLRDWFAGQAMFTAQSAAHHCDRGLTWEETAVASYAIADAMLAERAKGGVA